MYIYIYISVYVNTYKYIHINIYRPSDCSSPGVRVIKKKRLQKNCMHLSAPRRREEDHVPRSTRWT